VVRPFHNTNVCTRTLSIGLYALVPSLAGWEPSCSRVSDTIPVGVIVLDPSVICNDRWPADPIHDYAIKERHPPYAFLSFRAAGHVYKVTSAIIFRQLFRSRRGVRHLLQGLLSPPTIARIAYSYKINAQVRCYMP
jgi:hypothetical protein